MNMSVREKTIWVELILDMAIAIYYFTSVYQLSGWNEITGEEIGSVIRNSIIFAIGGSILLHLIFIRNSKIEDKDERDYIIDARANAVGYYTLFALCCILVGHIMIGEGLEYFFSWRPEPLSNPFIMHLIALSLLASAYLRSLVRLICYRRGY